MISTTPKPVKLLKELVARNGDDVVVTRGSTYDNRANLPPSFFTQIIRRNEGTRLGRQELAAHLLTMEADVELAKQAAVERACRMVEKEAKRVLGTYDYGWESLKPETIARKARGNSPLLETGKMRDSISHYVTQEGRETVGYVGSTSKIALYQEMGTRNIPPRPFLSAALMAKERAIVEMTEKLVIAAITQGGPNYRELREIIHLVREFGREVKKIAHELLDDPDDSEEH